MRFLLFLLLFIPLPSFSQNQNNLDFELINQDIHSVKQNSKLELGLTLPDTVLNMIDKYLDGKPHRRGGLNPFMSWDIDVKAYFKHVSSGVEDVAIGFWYSNMEINTTENKWDYLETKLPYRVRYAPSQTGDWQVRIEVDIKGKPTYFSKELNFKVLDSQAKGFVTLNSESGYLERDGKTIIPTGVNLPFPYNKNNLMYSLNKNETLDLEAWEEYNEQIKSYISQGGEYFRMLLHPSSTEIEFEEVGYYQARQNYAWEIDRIIQMCEESNTLIQFNLMYHSYFMKLGDYSQFRFDYSDYWPNKEAWPYKDPNEISGYSRMLNSKTPSDMFLNEMGMRFLKQRTRYIMARWGYSTSISNVELLCEPWHIDENPYAQDAPYDALTPAGDTARKAVYEYHKQMSSYIKDTLRYNHHLLSAVGRFPAGKERVYSHLTDEDPNFIDSTWYLDNIDLISISYYSKSPEKMLVSKSNKNNECGEGENSVACVIDRLNRTYGKPVIFGESDHGDDTYECSDYQGHYIDVMRFPFTGAIGHYIWAAFIVSEADKEGRDIRDERVSWPRIIQSKNYFNKEWFGQLVAEKEALGRQKENFQKSSKGMVETQYIIGKDKAKAGGYLYNRSFNIATASGQSLEQLVETSCVLASDFLVPVSITWKPQRLHVEGLQSFTKYRIVFYNYTEGDFLLQAELRSTLSGKLKLVHPLLDPEKDATPLVWYRIEKVN